MTDTKSAVASPQTSHGHPFIALVMGVLAVSLAAIFIRLAQGEGVPSLLIATGRLVLAALILTPVVIQRPDYIAQMQRLSKYDMGLAVVSGAFLAIHFAAWVTSLEYTTVLISVVLVTTTPIWVAILEVTFLRARLSYRVIIGLFVTLTGGTVIGLAGGNVSEGANSEPLIGAALSVIGAIQVAVYLVIGRKLRAQLSLTPYIWIVYGIASLVMCIVLLLAGTPVAGQSIEGYGWILALALFPQLVGHSSLNYALAYLPATYVSLSTQLEPILSALVAYVVFAEIPGAGEVIGGVIIVLGVVIATVRPRHG